MSVFGPGVSQFAGLLANVTAALLSAVRAALSTPHHPPDPTSRATRATRLQELLRLIGPLWFVPFLLLVGISGQHGGGRRRQRQVMRRALLRALVDRGHGVGVIRRAYARGGGNQHRAWPGAELRYFGYTLLYIANLLLVEIGLRVLGMSLAGLMEGGGSQFGPRA